MTINTYTRMACPLCGQIISANGLSKTSHMNMHVREGYFVREDSLYHGKRFTRTDKPFDRQAYQQAHPERAYNQDDYWPITGNTADAKIRRRHMKLVVKRKTGAAP